MTDRAQDGGRVAEGFDPSRRRWEPYTRTGIKRVGCRRCGAPSSQQWQVCADFSSFRAICFPCDVEVNRLILEFMRFPNVDAMIAAYRERMIRLHPDLCQPQEPS